MKKKTIFITLVSLALAGCSSNVKSNRISYRKEVISTIEKTTLRQHYKDYDNISLIAKGEIKVAVIPIWFMDSPLRAVDKVKTRKMIDDAFFGSPKDIGWHSVKSYYEKESMGQLKISGKTSYWFDYFGNSTDFYTRSSITDNVLKEATEWFFASNPNENRADYDADKDGYLDSVSFIYSTQDYYTLDLDSNNMWAYKSSITSPSANVGKPGLNVFFWASYDFLKGSANIRENNALKFDTSTFIHEFGHTFGIVDYYDYNHQYSPAGGFSMQDQNVGGHDPYSVMSIGWADPYIPTESMTIQIGAFQSTHDLILLTPEWNTYDSPFDEYLLLELYTPTGLNEFHDTDKGANDGYYHHTWPSELAKTGIRLWHVDSRLTYRQEYIMPPWSKNLICDATYPLAQLAMSNTYHVEGGRNEYCSPLGSGYYNYNLLECIQYDGGLSEYTGYYYNQSLFVAGKGFSLVEREPEYDEETGRWQYFANSTQFVNEGKLNSGKDLGWAFVVESIDGDGDDAVATIRLIKD